MGAPSPGHGADPDGTDSAVLVRRAQQGDASAWESLYLRYHDQLLFAVRCRLGSTLRQRVTSEDILHSVVADALSDIRAFEPRGKGALGRWLATCVVNKIRSKAEHHAARKREGGVQLSDSIAARLSALPDEEPRYLDGRRWEDLEGLLLGLDEVQRDVVVLRAVDGLSNAEVAQQLGKSPEATSKAYNRALARLGARLAARGAGSPPR
jgi:RNA polymerase sigma factor (sigma-70 family)